jgi:predicted amidophosphoribosyltransferase
MALQPRLCARCQQRTVFYVCPACELKDARTSCQRAWAWANARQQARVKPLVPLKREGPR